VETKTNSCTPQQQELASGHIKFMYARIHHWKKQLPFIHKDDIESAAAFGFTKAIKAFDPSRGLKPITLIARAIDNEVLQVIRKFNNKDKKTFPLSGFQSTGVSRASYSGYQREYDYSDIEANLFRGEDSYTELDRMDIASAMEVLKPIEKEVIILAYLSEENLGQYDLADVLGLSQSYISRVKSSALRKMRHYFERSGAI
jgi:RNA polymerase sigma factor (sigma-70 family)